MGRQVTNIRFVSFSYYFPRLRNSLNYLDVLKPNLVLSSSSRSSHRRCSIKKTLLNILHNSRENTCAGVSFSILQCPALLKERLRHGFFPVNFAKSLRTPSLRTVQCNCFLSSLPGFTSYLDFIIEKLTHIIYEFIKPSSFKMVFLSAVQRNYYSIIDNRERSNDE